MSITKFKINMISAITNTGKTMFSLYDKSINVDRFIDFLQKVIDSSNKKVFLIVAGLLIFLCLYLYFLYRIIGKLWCYFVVFCGWAIKYKIVFLY